MSYSYQKGDIIFLEKTQKPKSYLHFESVENYHNFTSDEVLSWLILEVYDAATGIFYNCLATLRDGRVAKAIIYPCDIDDEISTPASNVGVICA